MFCKKIYINWSGDVMATCCKTPAEYTLCSEKNTHSRFLLYLRGKCLDFYKIFRKCLGKN